MAVRLLALRAGRFFIPQEHKFYVSGTHFCQRLSKPQGLVRPEGLGKLLKIHFIGSRTCDLPVCSIVPQPLRYRVLGEKSPACMLLMGKPEGKRSLERPRSRWVDNINMVLGKRVWRGLD
jgi:hypothetical protein